MRNSLCVLTKNILELISAIASCAKEINERLFYQQNQESIEVI